jgi:hypothetical protein
VPAGFPNLLTSPPASNPANRPGSQTMPECRVINKYKEQLHSKTGKSCSRGGLVHSLFPTRGALVYKSLISLFLNNIYQIILFPGPGFGIQRYAALLPFLPKPHRPSDNQALPHLTHVLRKRSTGAAPVLLFPPSIFSSVTDIPPRRRVYGDPVHKAPNLEVSLQRKKGPWPPHRR